MYQRPSDSELLGLLCIEQVGEAFTDQYGRYRQVSFKAKQGNCKDEVTFINIEDASAPMTLTIKVWPTAAPVYDGYTVFNLDVMPWEDLTIEAGNDFIVITSEIDHHPQGFPWEEPAQVFNCVNVMSTNYGEFQSGYRVWLLNAKGEVCEETIPINRPTWWTGEDM
jgi:hypothetical protein